MDSGLTMYYIWLLEMQDTTGMVQEHNHSCHTICTSSFYQDNNTIRLCKGYNVLFSFSEQTSCASTPSSTMKTCRRSLSILWCATWMPQASTLVPPRCHKGMMNTHINIQTSISHFTHGKKYMYRQSIVMENNYFSLLTVTAISCNNLL